MSTVRIIERQVEYRALQILARNGKNQGMLCADGKGVGLSVVGRAVGIEEESGDRRNFLKGCGNRYTALGHGKAMVFIQRYGISVFVGNGQGIKFIAVVRCDGQGYRITCARRFDVGFYRAACELGDFNITILLILCGDGHCIGNTIEVLIPADEGVAFAGGIVGSSCCRATFHGSGQEESAVIV